MLAKGEGGVAELGPKARARGVGGVAFAQIWGFSLVKGGVARGVAECPEGGRGLH